MDGIKWKGQTIQTDIQRSQNRFNECFFTKQFIDTYEYKHAKIDWERQRECYFQYEIYSDFIEVYEDTPVEQIMKEVCQEMRKRFEGISVDFLLCKEVEV